MLLIVSENLRRSVTRLFHERQQRIIIIMGIELATIQLHPRRSTTTAPPQQRNSN